MDNEFDIAIVGMSCRLPGASSLEEFWRNLAGGVESIARLSDQEILDSGVPASHLRDPNYVKAAPILDEPGGFDAAFFGYAPMEARSMDPQQRILLELAHEALEHAGCDPDRYPGRVGVFTGSALNTYFTNAGLNRRLAEEYIPTLIGNDKDFLSTRISYKLNLKGPSLTVQTACSTSLVAIHLARQSLMSQETDVALAGAISVRVPHRAGYFADAGGVVSPDGHVRAFDAKANGTVFGSGGGVLVLKRLADALAEGDTIHAVIKGSAVNNDGTEKAGYTAPSVNGQADAVIEALANAGVDADSISYVEAHGSGTPVGDPIEVRALTRAFRTQTQRSGYCAIGSVKTNVGHLDAAAGVAGVIKTVLALKHRKLPPSLNFTQPNPEIDFAASPFYVNAQLRDWASDGPRRAGVVATGMGGTNAHVVLEEAPEIAPLADDPPPHLLILSARTQTALDQATRRMRDFLRDDESASMSDVAYTLQAGRKAYPHRRFVVCADRADAIAALGEEHPKKAVSGVAETARRPVVLLLPGVGDHYVGMAYDLYAAWPGFRQDVDRCADILRPHLGADIRDILYPSHQRWRKRGATKGIDLKKMLGRGNDAAEDADARTLNQTLYAQPALFTIEYATARLWQALGVTPDAIVGHSMGEYVAACLSGVLTLEDALRLIAMRARLVSELPQGAMLAVALSEQELRPLLPTAVSIALINGPQLCVVAGPAAAVAEFANALSARGVIARQVQNAHAFHSRMLDPIVEQLEEEARKARMSEPRIPYVSNVTGTWIKAHEATSPAYWAMHANRTARFDGALRELWKFTSPVLLEAGPGRTLSVLAMQHPDRAAGGDPLAVQSLRHGYENESDTELLLQSVGRLWLTGAEIRWENCGTGAKRRRVALATYPFERRDYWLSASSIPDQPAELPARVARAPLDRWFYVPAWERAPLAEGRDDAAAAKASWLIIADPSGTEVALLEQLQRRSADIHIARFGGGFRRLADGSFEIDPARSGDYVELLRSMKITGTSLNVVHLGCLVAMAPDADDAARDHRQDYGFFSLLHLAQAIGALNIPVPVRIGVISSQIQEVTGDEALDAEMATALGPAGVMPRELPNVACFNVDLAHARISGDVAERILAEFGGPGPDGVIAYRGRYRWQRKFVPCALPARDAAKLAGTGADATRLRQRGVYLITGGTGGLGLALAQHLARTCQARIVLTKQSAFPPKSTWQALLDSKDAPAATLDTVEQLLAIERLGGEVEVLVAEASSREQMQRAIQQTIAKFQCINGVIHLAGIVHPARITNITRQAADRVLAPKVRGTMILHELLRGIDLDFMVLYSSMSSVTTPFAHADYSAANWFLDAFAAQANTHGRFPVLAINWPVWKEAGIGARSAYYEELEAALGVAGLQEEMLKGAMATGDGLEAFTRALGSRHSQIVVSPEDLNDLIAKSRHAPARPARAPGEPAAGPAIAAEARSTGDLDAPATEIEAGVEKIWAQVFGHGRIGIHEEFSALGGHSLIAMQIVSKIRSTYRVDFSLKELFEAPTIARTSALIGARRSSGSAEPADDGQIRALPRVERRAPAGSERRLWFFDQLEPGSAAYNVAFQLAFDGELRVDALEAALAAVLARHDILRTHYQAQDGEPCAICVPPSAPGLTVREAGGADPSREASRLVEEDAQRPFDLHAGPLWRALLVQLSARRFLLGVTFHHVIADGWSVGIFTRELLAAYEALKQGLQPQLPPLPFQYADFASWESRWVRSDEAGRQLDFWRNRLAGVRSLDLPTDFPRPRIQTFRGANCSARLTEDLHHRLAEFSRAHGVTPFMTLVAVFGLLLHRLSGADDVALGVPVAGRGRKGTDQLIGMFINTIVLRQDHSGDPSFRELLGVTRTQALEGYSNAEVPFDQVVEAVRAPRDAGRSPLFQVLINTLDFSAEMQFSLPGIEIAFKVTDVPASKFDMTLYLGLEEHATRLMLAYNSDVFGAARMQELLGQFQTLLAQALAEPERRVSEFSLLTPSATKALPYPARALDGRAAESLPATLAPRMAQAAARIAVSGQSASWTYADLQARAGGLAEQLLQSGVQKGDVVAIYARRDTLLACAMLGVLRAGAAFAMLDPAYPGTRLAASWRSAAPRAVVLLEGTGEPHAALEAEMAALPAERRIRLSGTLSPSSEPGTGTQVLGQPVGPEDLAYVAFTSGTTGGVKAILGTHGPVVHFLDWVARKFNLGPDDRFGMLSGLSHDPLLRDVLAPFWVGASLHVPDPSSMGEPGWLGAWIARERLTVVHLTPAMAELVTSGAGERIDSLRWIFVGGDVMTAGLVESLRRVAPNATCVNFYGATETPQAMAFHVAPQSGPLRARLPLGHGIDDVQLLVLNARDAQAGVGEPGEIVVRTPHLALGYRGDAELTRQRFTANPLASDPADRVYRTGDLGRYLPDGSVEFIGRRDAQAKLRGFRLELGAIEATLCEHPSVAHAVAALREEPNDERRLAAYVVPRPGMTVEWAAVRAFLRERLPEYAVPTAYGLIDSIPLGPNGKVDRGALPEPDGLDSQLAAFEPPLGPSEQAVAAIFAEVLARPRVGRHDNFFDLGGHSLLGTRAVSRVRAALRVEVSLRALFEAPTPAGLAAHVDAQLRSPGEAVMPIPRAPRDGELPLSFSQQRLWFLHQLDPQSVAYNLASAMQLTGRLGRDALSDALRAIVARHEPLRTVFHNRAGTAVQVVLSDVADAFALREVAADAYTDEELKAAINAEANKPFDLERGPLLRAFLYRRTDAEHVLLLCAHHIALDAWSFGIITRELAKFYEQRMSGSDAALAPLPLAYVDFACWQRERLKGPELQRLVAYWRASLDGAPQVLELPADRPRPSTGTSAGARYRFELPRDLQDKLRDLSRRERSTLFMTLLAAFALLLSRYSAQRDLLIGTPVANRNRAEIEGLVGFFVNTLLLRVDLGGDLSVSQLLARIRETCLDAYAHQDLPFEQLVEELQPARDLSRNPLFQVMFALQNASSDTVALKGLATTRVELDFAAAQFDLTLNVRETEEGLKADFEYATDLFDESTIARMAGHWRSILEAMAATPEYSVWTLPMLSESERRQLLQQWSGESVAYPANRLVHELIAEQAGRTPDAPAVISGGRHLTYAELERRANQLAHALRKRGVGPEVMVGLCVKRSAEMIVALLGVLKAGGAYVPLDPDYPSERLALMLDDCGVKVLVTEQALLASLQPMKPDSVAICLDRDAAALSAEPHDLPISQVGPANLAYAIFTSGSTGRPKAALLTHKGLANLAQSEFRLYGIGPHSRLLQFVSLSFDQSLSDITAALCSGAALYVETREVLPLGPALEQYLERERITVLSLTPSALAVLSPDAGPSLEQINVCGEACSPDLAARWAGRCRFFNTYGPTEVSVTTTYIEYRDGLLPPLIGRPLPNLRVYLLDERLEPVPQGVPGELYIGGVGVARGYLNRPELTAERFLPDPFGGAGAVMYKSGDFARWRAGGQIEFIGRRDDQVKVRGFRIELGEIEALISSVPEVQGCAVVVLEGNAGNRSLAAYVVPRKDAQLDLASLRAEVRRSLPDYMVPAHFVSLDALPQTPNGKVDRKALPAPLAAETVSSDAGLVAPRNDLEIGLAAAWAKVLDLPRVGMTDNFFELGGNSLSVVKLVFEMKTATGLEIGLGEIFRFPTIAQLVTNLGPDATRHASVVVPLQPEGSGVPVFCICGIVIYKEFASSLGTGQPVYGVYVEEEQAIVNQVINGTKPEVSIERLVDAYHAAIVRFRPQGPFRLAGLSFGGILAMELAAKMRKDGAEVEVVLLLDALLPQAARHNWGKWVSHQAREIANGKGLAKLRRVSERLRQRIGARRSRPGAGGDLDEPLLIRGVSLLEGSFRWRMRHSNYDFKAVLFRATNHLPYVDLEEGHGWSRYLGDRLTIVDTTGGHRSIIEPPNVAELGRKVRPYLQSPRGN